MLWLIYHITHATHIDDKVLFEIFFEAVDLGANGGVVNYLLTPNIALELFKIDDASTIS
jgi:hypothetical protein